MDGLPQPHRIRYTFLIHKQKTKTKQTTRFYIEIRFIKLHVCSTTILNSENDDFCSIYFVFIAVNFLRSVEWAIVLKLCIFEFYDM